MKVREIQHPECDTKMNLEDFQSLSAEIETSTHLLMLQVFAEIVKQCLEGEEIVRNGRDDWRNVFAKPEDAFRLSEAVTRRLQEPALHPVDLSKAKRLLVEAEAAGTIESPLLRKLHVFVSSTLKAESGEPSLKKHPWKKGFSRSSLSRISGKKAVELSTSRRTVPETRRVSSHVEAFSRSSVVRSAQNYLPTSDFIRRVRKSVGMFASGAAASSHSNSKQHPSPTMTDSILAASGENSNVKSGHTSQASGLCSPPPLGISKSIKQGGESSWEGDARPQEGEKMARGNKMIAPALAIGSPKTSATQKRVSKRTSSAERAENTVSKVRSGKASSSAFRAEQSLASLGKGKEDHEAVEQLDCAPPETSILLVENREVDKASCQKSAKLRRPLQPNKNLQQPLTNRSSMAHSKSVVKAYIESSQVREQIGGNNRAMNRQRREINRMRMEAKHYKFLLEREAVQKALQPLKGKQGALPRSTVAADAAEHVDQQRVEAECQLNYFKSLVHRQ